MGKKVLLIADDVEMNRTVIKRFLKSEYEVLEAVDGRRALEILEETPVDLLLLDIIMPEVDGLEVLQAVKASDKYQDMGILVATSTKEKTERTALSLGADDIVSKPYDPIVIRKRLQNILAMKESNYQKRALEHEDTQSFLEDYRKHWSEQVEKSAASIHKLASLVEGNQDNPKLLAEIAGEIHKEAEKVALIFERPFYERR